MPSVKTGESTSSPSVRMLQEARHWIPGATQTISKGPDQFAFGVSPIFLEKGRGCRVWDVEGREYIDYVMGLCSVTLGHADAAVNAAITRQLADGISFSLPHPIETRVAAQLCDLIPCAEQVRFAKNGSDATSGAVRAARAITGREHVAICGYHGPQDWYIGTTARHLGVPQSTKQLSHLFGYNDLESLEHCFREQPGQIAAVIMEPVSSAAPQPGFLEGVAEMTRAHGALLIFDEIITGFRWDAGGAQAFFGITPDMACFGKGMANGMPIAAVVGKREVMQIFERIFFSYTFGGETLSLAAAECVLRQMREAPVIDHLWRMGERLMAGCADLIQKAGLSQSVSITGYPPRFLLRFADAEGWEANSFKTLFIQEAARRGILTTGAHNLSYGHQSSDIERTLDVYREIFACLHSVVESGRIEEALECPPTAPVFRPV